jgi:type I restriction enzyme S subunit
MQTEAFNEHSVKQSKGSVNPYINFSDLAWYEFALPPLDEQRKMVQMLRTTHAILASYTYLHSASRNVVRSLQKKYFLELPEGRRVRIGDVADVQNGTTPARANPDYWDGNIPWLPTGKVNDRVIYSADQFITEKALSECSLNIVSSGSTLVAMIGQGQTRGRAARLELDACINQNFGAVTPGKEMESWYLFYYLESSYERLRGWSHGTNQHALNCSLIRDFPIPLPSKERQLEIATELRAADNASRLAEERKDDSALLLVTVRETSLKISV